ncbi:hypothetical protein Hdeb2414_s0006g00217631 [Helianthus debilis subsp. tardiflorus]
MINDDTVPNVGGGGVDDKYGKNNDDDADVDNESMKMVVIIDRNVFFRVWRRRWCKSGWGSGAWVSLGHVTFQFRVVRFKPVVDNGSSQIHVSISSFGSGRGQTGFTSIRQVRGSGQLVNGSVKDGQNQSTHNPE